ncbi:hypothetical protein MN608_01310 [Microdochium nivale]|nr:hypothetical protein MN608_01310 [Microdochium nivale]
MRSGLGHDRGPLWISVLSLIKPGPFAPHPPCFFALSNKSRHDGSDEFLPLISETLLAQQTRVLGYAGESASALHDNSGQNGSTTSTRFLPASRGSQSPGENITD